MDHIKGQSLVALVILVGTVAVLIGTTLAFLASSFVDSSYGYSALVQADAAATAGAQDALLQLDRNVAFSSVGGYTVPVGSSTATVTVTPSSTAGCATIVSVATVSHRTRKISAVVSVSTTTDQAYIVSWQTIQ
jgi:hypothetical protein